MTTQKPLTLTAVASLIAGLIGGLALAVTLGPVQAYQSPSSAAALQGLRNQGIALQANGASNGSGININDLFVGGTVSTDMMASRSFGFNLGSLNISLKVTRPMLRAIYMATLKRDLDPGAEAHVGKELPVVINDIMRSEEAQQYGRLMAAVKAYENAHRAAGGLSEADHQARMAGINNALSSLLGWVNTLPQQQAASSPSPSPTTGASPSPTATVSPTASPSPSPTP